MTSRLEQRIREFIKMHDMAGQTCPAIRLNRAEYNELLSCARYTAENTGGSFRPGHPIGTYLGVPVFLEADEESVAISPKIWGQELMEHYQTHTLITSRIRHE